MNPGKEKNKAKGVQFTSIQPLHSGRHVRFSARSQFVCPQFWESKEGVEVDNARKVFIIKKWMQ